MSDNNSWATGIAIGLIGGFIAGCAAIISLAPDGPFLVVAQDRYRNCLELGAPEQNCLKKFLLPSGDNP